MIVKESVNDVLRGKTEEEIDDDINKILNIDKIEETIEKHKANNILCLYTYEESVSSTNYYIDSLSKNLIINLMDDVLDALKNKYDRYFVVYVLNPVLGGTFSEEGYGNIYKNGGVKILLEINVNEDGLPFIKIY